MAIAIVQTKAPTPGSDTIVTLDSTPTPGNLLVLWHACRDARTPLTPSGFTAVGGSYVASQFSSGADQDRARWFYRVVQSGDTATITGVDDGSAVKANVFVAEISGAAELDVTSSLSHQAQTGTSVTTDAVTPTDDCILLAGFTIWTGDGSTETFTPDGNTTELHDSEPGGSHPIAVVGYRIITTPSGSYTLGGDSSLAHTGGWGSQAVAFTAAPTAPTPGIWMDWGRDGFTDGSTGGGADDPRLARGLPQAASVGTAYGGDNVTDRVLRAEWWRGASYDHVGAAGPGGFTIILDNFDGLFDPDNASSPLYGFMTPGVPVWGGAIAATGALGTANGTGAVAGFLAGRVREFAPTVRDGQRVCEVIGEDALASYQRSIVSVTPSLTRSHAAFRGLILDGTGEDAARRSLDVENGMMPFSAVDQLDALSVLDELNRATATRHFVHPADTKEDWYYYTTANKLHRLTSSADQSLDGDDIDDVSGWRITNENIIEVQRATVEPITTTPDNAVVWEHQDTPFSFTNQRPRRITANFDDYVFDTSVDLDVTSGSGTASITNYGKSALVTIWATTPSVTVGSLRVLGQAIVRGDSVTVSAGDESAGALAGPTISSDYIGQTAAAQGIVDFMVWKFGQPLKRPQLSVVAKNAATLATIFDRDLFDVMTLSIDKLTVSGRRCEIIGLRGSVIPRRVFRLTYELQETANQSAITSWFVVDTDSVNGSQVLAPF